MEKAPIINCHTHVFTGDHVPPFLARTLIPAPFYFLFPLSLFISLFRWWYKYPATIPHTAWYKRFQNTMVAVQTWMDKFGPLRTIIRYYIAIQVFYILYSLVAPVFPPDQSDLSGWVENSRKWLTERGLLWNITSWPLQIGIILLVFILVPSGRNLILFLARNLWKVLGKLPGKETTAMFHRYLNIGRYAFHQEQKTVLSQLKGQYPNGTGLVVLPMDMEYMGAGKPGKRYRDQMEQLRLLKNSPANHQILFPFVFADPRRMVALNDEKNVLPGDKIYFDFEVSHQQVVLKDCFIRDYLEEYKFSGIKIYPALGYYPFDENLLALWKYTADNGIPVLTHCVSGPMFYRGSKEPAWNKHPVFEEAIGMMKGNPPVTRYGPLSLNESGNPAFTTNFTHPLNYLCLLEESQLRKLVALAVTKNPDTPLKQLFGYTNDETPLTSDLSHFKICFGHYGGGDQWHRYFEKDRYSYSSQLTRYPETGIRFLETVEGKPSRGKIEHIWKHTDWYSIISSMLIQYKNVYADISYILHSDAEIFPLLKQTLQHPVMKQKVLYGTDFYVVRNHKSDKNMLADMMGGLPEEQFDQIARINPRVFLQLPAWKKNNS